MQQPMPNPEDITDSTTAMNMALALMAKAFKLNYSTPTNNNQIISSNPRNRQIAQPDISDPTTGIDMTLALLAKAFTLNNTTPTNNNQRSSSNPSNMQTAQAGMNIDQDKHMLMVEDDIVKNMNGLSVVSKFANQYGNGNFVPAPAEGNGNCINGIQSTQEEFEFMDAADAYEETERVKANSILENNLQQASTSGTQSDKAPVYDSDGSAEVKCSHWQYKFPLPVKIVATARREEMPLPEVCT
nr:hypothetical protein [Tanacetum cinerariifolium]